MKREDVDKREKDLCDLLKSLSLPDLDVNNNEIYTSIVTGLHAVYDLDNGVYRHSYSKIFILLSKIHTDPIPNSLDILIQNLRYVYYTVQKDARETPEFRKAIYKLYDHVNLDIARINFLDNQNEGFYSKFLTGYKAISQGYDELKSNHVEIIESNNSIKQEYNNLKEEFASLEKQAKDVNKKTSASIFKA